MPSVFSGKPTERREQIEASDGPFGERQALRRDVGPLAFAHQPGNIDAGRTLKAAGVAMDAEIGDHLALVGRQQPEIERAGQDAAYQVRLGPG
jgi:hypothetical protein